MATVTEIVEDGTPSIQGEQQLSYGIFAASDDEVDAYVRAASEAVRACRESGRHAFGTVQTTGMRFVGVTALGLMIRRILCKSCGMVERVEEWDVRHKGGKVTRTEMVSAKLSYIDPSYLNKPGQGRMSPKQIRNAVASLMLDGLDFRELLREAKAASTS